MTHRARCSIKCPDDDKIEASAPGVCQKLIKVWAFCFNAADLVRVFSRDLKSALLSHAAQIVELGFGMLVNGGHTQ
jgi:hypothetical protein